ncbi:MAG: NBR1-Ig-like domain-containing protein [Anaerolineales bacterium]
MKVKRKLIWSIATIFLLSSFIVGSCSPVGASAKGPADTHGAETHLVVSSPDAARDVTLAYLRDDYSSVPSPSAGWNKEIISSQDAVATNTFLYSFRNWTVSVVSPIVDPRTKVFTVIVSNQAQDFKWAGLIDAFGEIKKMGQFQPTPVPPTPTFVPTNTPVPTSTPVPATSTPVASSCNDASFIDDVTVPDGTTFPPGTEFLKVWRLRNVGTCTWTTGYDLVFIGGNRMDAQRTVALAESVRPGETINVGVRMIAPNVPGNYQGFWMVQNANGSRFGIGDNADDSFWVSIQVAGNASNHKYDFALDYCDAIWRSGTGRVSCSDSSTPQNGTVQFLNAPNLENRHENEPTIWVHPNEVRDGWIEGIYPAITIQSGDSFKAWVGCLEGYELCDVTFYLSYVGADSHTHALGTWHEVYDNQVTTLDIDLSNLAGQSVQFILGVEANTTNVSSAQGFWFVPRIER